MNDCHTNLNLRAIGRGLAAWLVLACMALPVLAADIPLSSLATADADEDLAKSLRGNTVLAMMFSCECPKVVEAMGTDGPAMEAALAQARKPVRLLFVTPNVTPDLLKGFGKSLKLTTSKLAQDPANVFKLKMGNLFEMRLYGPEGEPMPISNTMGSGGGPKALETLLAKSVDDLGWYRYAPPTSGDTQVMDWWWDLEFGQPQALKRIIDATKAKPTKDSASALLDHVTAIIEKREADLIAASPAMIAIEDLEDHLRSSSPLQRPEAAKRVRALMRDPALKKELTARDAFTKAMTLRRSPKPSSQNEGVAILQQLANKAGETTYGGKARQVLGTLPDGTLLLPPKS